MTKTRAVSFIQYINRIWFGDGARDRLPFELEHHGIRRPMVMSDHGLDGAGVLAMVTSHLPRLATEFLDVPSNPTEAAVRAAVAAYRLHACDGIVAIGGGSVLDCAKAVAVAVTHELPIGDYSADGQVRAAVTALIAPIVAVPTTAGTGSEVGRGAGLTLDSGRKAVFLSPHLIPRSAVCDPELTYGLPAPLTAGTGIDAFSHALESYTSTAINPPADAIALDAVERLRLNLPHVMADGHDAAARYEVMMGAVEAAMTTWKGLGTAHALSMPLDRYDIHHGTAIGLLLPHTIVFAARALSKERLVRLSAALSSEPDPDAIAASVSDLVDTLQLPRSLDAWGVPVSGIPDIAREAAQTAFHRTAAVELTHTDYVNILERIQHAPNHP